MNNNCDLSPPTFFLFQTQRAMIPVKATVQVRGLKDVLNVPAVMSRMRKRDVKVSLLCFTVKCTVHFVKRLETLTVESWREA